MEWQRYFQEWMTHGYDYIEFPLQVKLEGREQERVSGFLSWYIQQEWLSKQVAATVECDSAVEAIAATIALDELKGVQFRDCAWCGSIFEVLKDNGRQYCDQQCAHRAGQKRRRAAAKIQQILSPSTVKKRPSKKRDK
jgi:hypothetical protein